MSRTILGLLCGTAALAMGVYACFVQADNFDEGARLQTMQVELEWYERRISGLRSEISRYEFMGQTEAFDTLEKEVEAPDASDAPPDAGSPQPDRARSRFGVQ